MEEVQREGGANGGGGRNERTCDEGRAGLGREVTYRDPTPDPGDLRSQSYQSAIEPAIFLSFPCLGVCCLSSAFCCFRPCCLSSPYLSSSVGRIWLSSACTRSLNTLLHHCCAYRILTSVAYHQASTPPHKTRQPWPAQDPLLIQSLCNRTPPTLIA